MKRALGHDLIADNIAELLALRLAQPERVLARYDDLVITYGEMGERVARMRGSLQREGIGQGDRVATFLHNCVDHMTILLACACEGAVWCPINVALASKDLRYTIRDLEPSLVFVGRSLHAAYEEAGEGLPAPVLVDDRAPDGHGLEPWLADGAPRPGPAIAPSDPLAITYSGGTTGLPKGVVKPHFAAIAAGLRLGEVTRFSAHERFFTTLQFSHGWTPLTVLPFCLYYGYEFCFWRWWSVSRFREYVRKYEATIIDPFIGMVATLLQKPPQEGDRDLGPRISIAGMGGMDPVALDLRARFQRQFGLETYQMYALTEAGALTCMEKAGEPRKPGSSGRTRGWYELKVVDDEGVELETGEVGEIVIRPLVPNIMARGYHGRSHETVRTWRDLWIHTSDLGRFDEDGYLFFLGRKGHFLRRRGELIAVSEVEHVLSGYPGVAEVAVVAVPSALGEDEAKACVVCPDGSVAPEALIDACLGEIAYFKVPRYVEFLDELPRSAAKQEIERFRLRERGVGEALDMAHVIEAWKS